MTKANTLYLFFLLLAAGFSGCNQDPVSVESTDNTFQNLIIRHEQIDPARNHNREEIDPNGSMIITVNQTLGVTGSETREVIYSLRHRLPALTGSKSVRDLNFGDVFINSIRLNRYNSIIILPDSLQLSGKPDTLETTTYYNKFNLNTIANSLSTEITFRATGSERITGFTQTLSVPEPVRILNLPQDALISTQQPLTLQFNQDLYAGFSGIYLYPSGISSADSVHADTSGLTYLFTDLRPTQKTRTIVIPAELLKKMYSAFSATFSGSAVRFGVSVYGVQSTSKDKIHSGKENGMVYDTPVHIVSNYSSTIRLISN